MSAAIKAEVILERVSANESSNNNDVKRVCEREADLYIIIVIICIRLNLDTKRGNLKVCLCQYLGASRLFSLRLSLVSISS